MKKNIFIFIGLFACMQTISAFNFINDYCFINNFINRIPIDSIETLQSSLHEKVRILNYHAKNNNASQKMLSCLHSSLTNEIEYLELQIKNSYKIDQKNLKQTAFLSVVAGISTYFAYYFYKKSAHANQAFLNIAHQKLYRNMSILKQYNECMIANQYKKRCHDQTGIMIGITACSYALLLMYAYNAYTLDPNRNTEFLFKYKQCLKLVELIQEIQSQ